MNTKEYYKKQPYTWQSNKDELFENALKILFGSAIEKIGDLKAGETILDIGCGNGIFLEYYHGNATYIGVDISPENIETAKKKYSHAQFILADATHIALEDNIADVTVCIETIEHLTIDEIQNLLEEMRRVTKPGGKVIITTPNLLYLWGVVPWSLIPFRRRMPVGRFFKGLRRGYIDENYTLSAHHYRFRPAYLRRLCARYFKVESVSSTYWYNNRAIHHLWPKMQLKIIKFSARHRFFWLNAGSQLVLSLVNNKKD